MGIEVFQYKQSGGFIGEIILNRKGVGVWWGGSLICSLQSGSYFSSQIYIFVPIINMQQKTYVKGCVRYIFCHALYFIKRKVLKNEEKCFLFRVKSSFHSRDILVFVALLHLLQSFQIQSGNCKME